MTDGLATILIRRQNVDLDHARVFRAGYHANAMRSLLIRPRRQWIAAALAFLLAFAGIVSAAHACSIEHPSSSLQSVADGHAADAPDDCAAMSGMHDAAANACQSHCIAGHQVSAQAEAPSALVAMRPVLRVASAERLLPAGGTSAQPSSIGAGPPPLLRFARLLI